MDIMERIVLQFMAAAALITLAASCEKGNTEEPGLPASVVSITAETWDIDYMAQTVKVGFAVEKPRDGVEVSFTTRADWVKIGVPADGEVVLMVEENDLRTQARTAAIVVGYDDLDPQTFTLTQDYLHARIALVRENESVDSQAQEMLVSVEVLDPIEGGSLTAENGAEWFSAEPESGGIRLRVQENTNGVERSSVVTVGYPGAEPASLSLVQKAVKEYETITGIRWALNNCGYSEENPYGILYNWKERETACPEGWRPADYKEMGILFSNTSEWTSHNGMNGRWYSGKTSYSEDVPRVFLPAAGAFWDGTFRGRGEEGYYWTDELNNNGRGVRGRLLTKDNEGSYGTTTLSTTNEKSRHSLRCVKD